MLHTISAIQMASGPHIKPNLMEATRLIREAAKNGAQMVVLPESFALMAMDEKENKEIAEDENNGEIQNCLKQCAIDNKVWIVAGSVPLKSAHSNKAYAASLMFDDKGKLVARYNKIHLFDVDIQNTASSKNELYRESDTFEAGNDIVVVETPFGKIGLSICYDVRFPMLYKEMVKQGAEILLVPAAFTYTTGEMHWEPLLKARAIENQCYVIAPAQGGFHINGRHTYGHSMVIDYLGQVKAARPKNNGIISIAIDLHALHKLRKTFPVLAHSRNL